MGRCNTRTILAAGIVRDIKFPTVEDVERYLEKLELDSTEYCELERYHCSDGQWIIRIVTKYSLLPLIEL